MAGFVVIPVLFYLPKFFEIRTSAEFRVVNSTIDCSGLLFLGGEQGQNWTDNDALAGRVARNLEEEGSRTKEPSEREAA